MSGQHEGSHESEQPSGGESAGDGATVERPDGVGAVWAQTSTNKTKFPSRKSCTWEKVLEASFKLSKAWAASPKEREGPSENGREQKRWVHKTQRAYYPSRICGNIFYEAFKS